MFYTKEQVERASQTNLVEFLSSNGETLRRSGSEFKWIYNDGEEHDSVSVKENRWYDHKNGVGGDAIAFLKMYNDADFLGAVATLINEEPQGDQSTWRELQKEKKQNLELQQEKKEVVEVPKKPFVLPTKNCDDKRLYAYLCKSRLIQKEVVDFFVKEGTIYQEEKYGNVVFLGKNQEGEIKSATKRGTHSEVQYRSTVAGSDTNYGFCHRVENSKELVIFEAPIDLLSYATLMEGDLQTSNLLTLDGLSPKAMVRFLEENKNIEVVKIALDHDVAGIETYEKFKDYLEPKGYETMHYITGFKDMNEMVKEIFGDGGIKGVEHPKIGELKKMMELLKKVNRSENTYRDERNLAYENQGEKFISKMIQAKFESIKNSLTSKNTDTILSRETKKDLMHLSDVCFFFYAKKLGQTYQETLDDVGEKYRAYLDKGKMKMHFEELKFAVELVQMDNPASVQRLGDAALKMNIYLQTQYQNDLEQYQKGLGKLQGIGTARQSAEQGQPEKQEQPEEQEQDEERVYSQIM
ncbi:MAG: DUF3991 and TOPRIM domain-containing protein [Bacillota bacterium]